MCARPTSRKFSCSKGRGSITACAHVAIAICDWMQNETVERCDAKNTHVTNNLKVLCTQCSHTSDVYRMFTFLGRRVCQQHNNRPKCLLPSECGYSPPPKIRKNRRKLHQPCCNVCTTASRRCAQNSKIQRKRYWVPANWRFLTKLHLPGLYGQY